MKEVSKLGLMNSILSNIWSIAGRKNWNGPKLWKPPACRRPYIRKFAAVTVQKRSCAAAPNSEAL